MEPPQRPHSPYTGPRSESPESNARSGWIVALYVLFGTGALVLIGGTASVYFFLQSEEGQKIVRVAQRGLELASVASSAPGTEELRAAGCQAAMVDTASSVLEVISPLLREEEGDTIAELQAEFEESAGLDLDGLVLVFCTVPQLGVGAPRCAELARVYGDAIEFPPDAFAVIVAQQGRRGPLCNGLYSPTGELMRPLIE